jgi:hypothetical protein
MNEQNTRKLYSDFPLLYRDRETTLMQWGFNCHDGWFALIYQLSAEIEKAAREVGLDPTKDFWPHARQVKEKFGTLRFYIDTNLPAIDEVDADISMLQLGTAPSPAGFMEFRPVASIEKIRDLVRAAEMKSAKICETCGQAGELRKGGWWHVSCDACETTREYR